MRPDVALPWFSTVTLIGYGYPGYAVRGADIFDTVRSDQGDITAVVQAGMKMKTRRR